MQSSDPIQTRAAQPAHSGWLVLAALTVGYLCLLLPTSYDLLYGRAAAYGRGHEPIVLVVVAWLLFRERQALAALPSAMPTSGVALLLVSLVLYVLSRSQQLLRIELLSLIGVLAGVLASTKGWRAVRLSWFALFAMLFMVPVPYAVVLKLTGPLQALVSTVAAKLMLLAGYPAGRSGVVITVGQYQLLVAEACAGLQTMFTLEAMGLLYMHLMNYRSWIRNALLATLVVPVSIMANVVRVVVLCLVTYHFGDAAGQSFVHGFSGLLLFAVGLAFIGLLDRLLHTLLPAHLNR